MKLKDYKVDLALGSSNDLFDELIKKLKKKYTDVVILIDEYEGTDSLIVSNPKEYTIKEVVNLIVENMGFKGKIVWRTDKPDGQLKKPSSNKRLMDIIGGYEFTTLEDGLKKSIDWFIENYENIRK